MVNFFKKVLLLKTAANANKHLKGVVVIESVNEKAQFDFNFTGKISSDYTIYISNENHVKSLDGNDGLKVKVCYENFNVLSGITIAVFNGINLICHGEYGKSFYNLSEICDYAKKINIKEDKEQDFTAEDATTWQEKGERFPYDDECIATENYYKLNDEPKPLHSQNANKLKTSKKAEEIEENEDEFNKHEANKRPDERRDFYQRIKNKIDEVFENFERCNDLSETLPNSAFVKIHYAENKYYYVGKIYENNTVKFICYGVMGNYEENQLKHLKNFSFIPLSHYDLLGKGFYLIFQDAKTGEIIKNKSG